MEDYFKILVNYFKKKYPLKYKIQKIVAITITILVLVAIIIVRKCDIFSDIWNLVINLLASFIAFIAAYYFVVWIAHQLQKFEDALKVSYCNSKMRDVYRDKKDQNGNLIKEHPYKKHFPLHSGDKYECEVYCNELFFHEKEGDFCINDYPNRYFEVNHFIEMHADRLLGAHSASKFKNEFTPRLEDFVPASPEIGNKNTLVITRSTYLNHLLTNRVLDYPITSNLSLRKLYEDIDELTALPLSKMSNHIGINALVFLTGEWEEKYLITPLRGENATVVKNGITASIATRLKVDDDYEAAKGHLEQYIETGCIEKSIERALLLSKSGCQEVLKAATIHFLGLARDPYEGGKPTLFYIVELNKTRTEFWKLINSDYKKEEIDEIVELMLVEWNDIHLTNVDNDNYDDEKLNLAKYYTCPPIDDNEHPNGIEHTDKSFIFEQNLITNFWFYLKHTGQLK